MTSRLMGASLALLLSAACMTGNETKPDAAQVAADAAAKKAADEKAAADAAGKKAADEKAAADKAAAEAADKLAHTAITMTSGSPEAIEAFQLGFQWGYAGHQTKALEQLHKAIALDGNFLLAQSYLALFTPGAEAMIKANALADAGAQLPEAEKTELQRNAAGKRGDTAKYEELQAKLLAEAPGDWRLQCVAGIDAMQARKLDQGAAAFQHAADLNPAAFLPHSLLAWVADVKGDRTTEIAEFQKAAAKRPGDAALQDDLVAGLIAKGSFDDAAAAIDVEEKLPGAGWEVHASRAAVDILRGDLAGGLKEAQAARALAKEDDDRLQSATHVLFAQLILNKHGEALKTAEAMEKEAKGKNPNAVIEAGIDRALVLIDQKKFAAAAKAASEVVARTATAGLSGARQAQYRREALVLLAWAQASAGKSAEAQAAADTLAKDAAADAATDADLAGQVSFAQGQALLAKGDKAGAVAALSSCIPENDVCRWAFAEAQEKSGDAAGAAATRAAILALNHADDRALWVRARIAPPAPAPKKS